MDEVEREGRLVFPFSAIVGLENAKLSLLCVAVNPLIGGVLLRGDKGTGKSTLVRALASVLPEIEVVSDCLFNCNPYNPLEMCDNCYKHYMVSGRLSVSRRRMRVVDMPLSITIDRLVGTIDVERFMKEGVKALQPGLLAEANRNILYIDEVNLLDDYIADSLLDVAAMGWNIIEREGVSFRHPARFILVGSMNPEEGELRPQILDRFGLCVNVEAPMDPEIRMEIVNRVEEFHRDPIGFYRKYEGKERELTERIIKARRLLPKVEISADLVRLLTETVIKLGIKTNRAEIVTIKTAKAIAALNGRIRVSLLDLEKAMELALTHRLREKPFHKLPKLSLPKINYAPKEDKEKRHEKQINHSYKESDKESDNKSQKRPMNIGEREERYDAQEAPQQNIYPFKMNDIEFIVKHGSSRDTYTTLINIPKGFPIGYTIPKNETELYDVDIYNSILSAILVGKKPPIKLGQSDIRVRIRKARSPILWVLILDSSGSMALQKRISVAKGIALSLIEQSYVKKAKMSLVVMRESEAQILVPPTRNYIKILEAVKDVPTGGRTPLSSALYNLLLLIKREKMRDKALKVRAFLITDGKANVPLYNKSIKEELIELGSVLNGLGVGFYIYDTRPTGINLGISYIQLLKEILNAHVFKI